MENKELKQMENKEIIDTITQVREDYKNEWIELLQGCEEIIIDTYINIMENYIEVFTNDNNGFYSTDDGLCGTLERVVDYIIALEERQDFEYVEITVKVNGKFKCVYVVDGKMELLSNEEFLKTLA